MRANADAAESKEAAAHSPSPTHCPARCGCRCAAVAGPHQDLRGADDIRHRRGRPCRGIVLSIGRSRSGHFFFFSSLAGKTDAEGDDDNDGEYGDGVVFRYIVWRYQFLRLKLISSAARSSREQRKHGTLGLKLRAQEVGGCGAHIHIDHIHIETLTRSSFKASSSPVFCSPSPGSRHTGCWCRGGRSRFKGL